MDDEIKCDGSDLIVVLENAGDLAEGSGREIEMGEGDVVGNANAEGTSPFDEFHVDADHDIGAFFFKPCLEQRTTLRAPLGKP